jgi:hypothetical protein
MMIVAVNILRTCGGCKILRKYASYVEGMLRQPRATTPGSSFMPQICGNPTGIIILKKQAQCIGLSE